MATPPLPTAIINKIKSRNQSVRWLAILREVREFRSYCCPIDSDNIMNVTKEPVVILSVSPNPVCLGNAISWNMAPSYAPGSTVTSRAIDFGDSSSDTGNSGTHTYAAAGEYTITATVTEGTGLTQTVEVEVNVIDCSNTILLNNAYSATITQGVFYWEGGTWTARNNGLTGNALIGTYIVQHPATRFLSAENHELLYTNADGLYHSINGGLSWAKITLPDPSNAEFSDSPAATVDELLFSWVDYDPTDSDIVYLLAYKSSVSRIWIYKSSDALASWSSRGVVVV